MRTALRIGILVVTGAGLGMGGSIALTKEASPEVTPHGPSHRAAPR